MTDAYGPNLSGLARLMGDHATAEHDPFLFETSQLLQAIAHLHDGDLHNTCGTCRTTWPCQDYTEAQTLALTWVIRTVADRLSGGVWSQ